MPAFKFLSNLVRGCKYDPVTTYAFRMQPDMHKSRGRSPEHGVVVEPVYDRQFPVNIGKIVRGLEENVRG